MVWKFCGKAQFPHRLGPFARKNNSLILCKNRDSNLPSDLYAIVWKISGLGKICNKFGCSFLTKTTTLLGCFWPQDVITKCSGHWVSIPMSDKHGKPSKNKNKTSLKEFLAFFGSEGIS